MWLLVVAIGYLLNAISSIVNKSLLNKEASSPVAYTFYICLLGLIVFVLAPFGLIEVSAQILFLSLFAGILFTYALLAMFIALAQDEVSRVTPLIGGWQPIFVFLLAFAFLGERLTTSQAFAFILVLLGGILITINWRRAKGQQFKMFFWSLLAALLFAVSYVLSKYVFVASNFISGFIWIRVGSFIGALFLLLTKKNRLSIFGKIGNAGQKIGLVFIAGQAAGALSTVLVNWAIALGSVTLVNALQGLQYVFLFFLVLLLSRKHPEWLRENTRGWVLTQKILAIGLIAAGLYFMI